MEKKETQAFLALQVYRDSTEDLVVMEFLVRQASEDHLWVFVHFSIEVQLLGLLYS